MKFQKLIKVAISLLIIATNISCDQVTKAQARDHISENEVIHVVADNFILTKVENTGAAMSLGANLSPNLKLIFLQYIPLLVLLLVFIYIIKERKLSPLNLVALSCIIGGGIGNIYDRILYNSVTDFMYIELGFFHTGFFYMADVSVVVGTALLFSQMLLLEFQKRAIKINL